MSIIFDGTNDPFYVVFPISPIIVFITYRLDIAFRYALQNQRVKVELHARVM